MNSPTSLSFLLIWNWNDTKYVHTLHSSLENHTRFQIKMGKVYTLPDGAAYTCMSYIRKYPPPGRKQFYREVKLPVYVKRQREFVPRDQFCPSLVVYFSFSTHKLVVSRNFLSIRIAWAILSAHFQCWEILNLNLTFAPYVKLKLSLN